MARIECKPILNGRWGWIGIQIAVGGIYQLNFMITAHPRSFVRADLGARIPSFVRSREGRTVTLLGLTLAGVPIGDQALTETRAFPRVEADGILGQDFLRRFRTITLDPTAELMELTD